MTGPSPTIGRLPLAVCACACVLSAWWGASAEERARSPRRDRAIVEDENRPLGVDEQPAAGEGPLVREGTFVEDLRGVFRRSGDRLLFQPSTGGRPWPVLENLNLERVARTIQDSGKTSAPWSVSGTVTEYRGTNYLLLRRAVLKAAAPSGRPIGAPSRPGAF